MLLHRGRGPGKTKDQGWGAKKRAAVSASPADCPNFGGTLPGPYDFPPQPPEGHLAPARALLRRTPSEICSRPPRKTHHSPPQALEDLRFAGSFWKIPGGCHGVFERRRGEKGQEGEAQKVKKSKKKGKTKKPDKLQVGLKGESGKMLQKLK
ncbi:unnamed protein product [Arctia plantaginis]|uniref:Uncharacterized protein n=1 Tax=Arctia plantaginis TaxID=874455 RepID=A0A8S1B1Z9_ARCPL|nr:unnamed protein product [Arctia plantaginis]